MHIDKQAWRMSAASHLCDLRVLRALKAAAFERSDWKQYMALASACHLLRKKADEAIRNWKQEVVA